MIIIIGLLFFNGVKWILFNGGYYVIFGWEMVNVIILYIYICMMGWCGSVCFNVIKNIILFYFY